MSRKYELDEHIPSEVLCKRLNELSDAVTKDPARVAREFTMCVPAECDRDPDIVLWRAAQRIEALANAAQSMAHEIASLRNEFEDEYTWNEYEVGEEFGVVLSDYTENNALEQGMADVKAGRTRRMLPVEYGVEGPKYFTVGFVQKVLGDQGVQVLLDASVAKGEE